MKRVKEFLSQWFYVGLVALVYVWAVTLRPVREWLCRVLACEDSN